MNLSKLPLALMALAFVSSTSKADFACLGKDGLKVKAFTLANKTLFLSGKAAVIVQENGINQLLTGTVQYQPTRVGNKYQYKLTDSVGESASLSLTDQSIFAPEDEICGRGECIPHIVKQVSGTLNYSGKLNALECSDLP